MHVAIGTTESPTVLSRQTDAPARWADLFLGWVDRWRRWLLGATVMMYLLGINGQWRIEPDSALYLSIARNLATGQGYTYHDKPCAIAYPGLPYALSLIFRVFPGAIHHPLHLVPENLLMLLTAGLTLALTYRLMLLNAGRPTAVLVTCGVALTRTFYRAAFALMTDMPFLLGVMAFLTGFEAMLQRGRRRDGRTDWRNKLLMIGGMALAIAMRPAWLAFVPVAVIALIAAGVGRRMNRRAVIVGVVTALLAAAAFFAADPRRAAGHFRPDRYEDQVFEELAPGQRLKLMSTAAANAIDIVRQTTVSAMVGIKFGAAPDVSVPRRWYDELGAVLDIAGSIAFLGLGLSLVRRRAIWGAWVGVTILMMILVLPHERYFLQILPLLIFGWWRGLRWINVRLPEHVGNILFALLLALGFVPNLFQVCGVVIEQRSPRFLEAYRGGKCAPLVAAAETITDHVPAGGLVLAPDKTARILTYLSDRTVVESNEQANDLRLNIDWPPAPGRRIYALVDPNNAAFARWLAGLGVNQTLPIEGGATAPMGGMELRRVPRWQVKAYYQQMSHRAAVQ